MGNSFKVVIATAQDASGERPEVALIWEQPDQFVMASYIPVDFVEGRGYALYVRYIGRKSPIANLEKVWRFHEVTPEMWRRLTSELAPYGGNDPGRAYKLSDPTQK